MLDTNGMVLLGICPQSRCQAVGTCRSKVSSRRSKQGMAGHSALPPGSQPGSSSPSAAHACIGTRRRRQSSPPRPCRPVPSDGALCFQPGVHRSAIHPATPHLCLVGRMNFHSMTSCAEQGSSCLEIWNSSRRMLFCQSSQIFFVLEQTCHTRLAASHDCLRCAAESHAAVASATKQSAAVALLLKGLPWNRAGAPGLAAVSALTHLSCHDDAPSQERCLAFAQLAQHAAEHKGYRAAEQVQCKQLSVLPLHKAEASRVHGPINS